MHACVCVRACPRIPVLCQYSDTKTNHIIEPQRDFQQCDILTYVDSDEPVQSLLELRNSK